MRLFFGIYPPESVQHEAAAVRDRIGDGKPIATPKLHITLCFLGEKDSEEPHVALGSAVAARHDPFRIALEGFGDFGHVYWLGVRDASPLIALAEDLGGAAERPYHPHLTLARVRRARRHAIEARTSPFDVREFHLIESRGGQYVIRHTFTLGRTRPPA